MSKSFRFTESPGEEPIPDEPEPPNACAPFFDAGEEEIFLQLACLSEADPVGPPLALDAFDPGDPFSRAEGQCSIEQPQFCHLVIRFMQDVWSSQRYLVEGFGIVANEQWLWESGTEYAIVEATGEFASYQGGKVFALGPEGARVGENEPDAENSTVPPGFSLLVAEPGPDPEATLFVGVVPEPGSPALAAEAIATLGTVARRRRATARAAASKRRKSGVPPRSQRARVTEGTEREKG